MKKYIFFYVLFFLSTALSAQQPGQNNPYNAYLFTYFTGNGPGEEAIRFAISFDGFKFTALNNNNPVINSELISSTGGVRDPHILRGNDGKTFYMVATDMQVAKYGWGPNHAMVLMKSTDLINWNHSIVNVPKTFSQFAQVNRVWAPQTIYDPQKKKYMVYFSMRTGKEPDKIYYAYANKDFTALESKPKQLFFNPTGGACIDGDIVFKDGKYHLFFKTEDQGAGLKIAISDKLTEGYKLIDKFVQQTSDPVEGSGVYKLNNGDGYVLMYDVYTKGRYEFATTKDLKTFERVEGKVSMNFKPRHGTVLPLTMAEVERLKNEKWDSKDLPLSTKSKEIKQSNIVYDKDGKKLYLPVKHHTNLSSFNPEFTNEGVLPLGPQNFTKGPIKYTAKNKQEILVFAQVSNNPVLEGYYADPDILYSNKTGKYYIYPTSDGFTGWSGTYFKTFSSDNLVDWKDEGIILDLKKNVSWADRNAWAPCIIEKKIKGEYKYFYYFTAAQKIGVAVSDNPTGPFVDSGKPLISEYPDGITGGQQIDPDVFTDPKTGKSYLYWGNGYMAGAELNGDMMSLKEGTIKVMTPDTTFREGAHVFYRNGTYYFMWSADDTRSENYRVYYGTSDSPLGPIKISDNNLVLGKDKTAGIYATGHNSVIQIPGKDEWYIVYHRFNYPKGISMGSAAGYNREVCIDRLEFNDDGSIKQVNPTHEGIKPL